MTADWHDISMLNEVFCRNLDPSQRYAAVRTSITSIRLTMRAKYECEPKENTVLPLYQDPHFSFHFADDRRIPRFHLEGIEVGRRVSIYKIDAKTGERGPLLATAIVEGSGWVDLSEPFNVRAGDAFIVVPEPE